MRGFWGVAVLIFVGVAGWQVSLSVDPDVALFVVGLVFGVAASLPAALLMLVAQRRNESRGDHRGERESGSGWGSRGHQADHGYPSLMVLPPQASYPAQPQPQPTHNPYMVTGGGAFDDMPQTQQDGRFRLNGSR